MPRCCVPPLTIPLPQMQVAIGDGLVVAKPPLVPSPLLQAPLDVLLRRSR